MKLLILSKQKGAVLVSTMLILLVTTALAVSGLRSSVLGDKMVSNQRNNFLAVQAADSVVRDGENWLLNQAAVPQACTTNACDVWSVGSLPNLLNTDINWWTNNAVVIANTINNVIGQPRYVLEEMLFIPDDLSPESWAQGKGTHYYEVTGHGIGGSNNAETLIQSVYATRFN